MRSLMCLLFLVIFCSVQMTSSATFALDAGQSHCCVKFSNVKIPVNRVVSYYWTSSSSCSKHAIVFKTIAGKEICVDPATAWVSGHVDKVSKRTTTATETNATTTTTATETNATTTTATETNATTTTTATTTTATETNATKTTATETTATESNATSTTTATKTTATESTSATSTTATTAKTQSLTV